MKAKVCNLNFPCEKYKKIPMRQVKHRELKHIFGLFQKLLPDHPNKDNTFIYVLQKAKMPVEFDMLFVCNHFEHDHKSEIPAILTIMEELSELSRNGDCHLTLLNGNGENVIFEIYEISLRMAKSLWKTGGKYE